MSRDEKSARVRRYFELMSASDIDGIVALFAPGAVIRSPFLGDVPAPEFFAKLGAASATSTLTVFDVLIGETGESAAGQFRYDWTLKTGEVIAFEGVDHFTFDAEGRFTSMSIYYDTHPLREEVGDKYA